MTDYFDANRRNWNERAGIHVRSQMYDRQAFLDDPEHLSSVVRFDQSYLGDLTGLDAVHLQCHIGNDTLSLARLGATVTGLDLSDESDVVARLLVPGGRLYLREHHPMLATLDDDSAERTLQIRYPYFETAKPIVFDDATSYTGDGTKITHARNYEWNHGIGEIITALLDHGLTLTMFHEHRGLEWQMLPHMVERDGQF